MQRLLPVPQLVSNSTSFGAWSVGLQTSYGREQSAVPTRTLLQDPCSTGRCRSQTGLGAEAAKRESGLACLLTSQRHTQRGCLTGPRDPAMRLGVSGHVSRFTSNGCHSHSLMRSQTQPDSPPEPGQQTEECLFPSTAGWIWKWQNKQQKLGSE